MDEQVQQPDQPPISKETLKKKGLLQSHKLLVVVGVVLLIGLAAILGAGKLTLNGKKSVSELPPKRTAQPTIDSLSPAVTIAEKTATDTTISYAKEGNSYFMRYLGRFTQQSPNYSGQAIEGASPAANVPWVAVGQGPELPNYDSFYNEILSFQPYNNGKSLLYVLRSDMSEKDKYAEQFQIFSYDGIKSTMLLSFMRSTDQHDLIPIIDNISTDGKYAKISLFSCWNCEGSVADTLILNITSGQNKRLGGNVNYFAWKTNGAFEYQLYKAIECELQGPGICPADTTVPHQTGQI